MRPSEVLNAEWLQESERLALKRQMEGTEEITEHEGGFSFKITVYQKNNIRSSKKYMLCNEKIIRRQG